MSTASAKQIEDIMDLLGGLITCDGNCHKPIEQGGAKPCDCPCCKRYG